MIHRRPHVAAIWVATVFLVANIAVPPTAQAFQPPIIDNPPEPQRLEILRAARLDPKDSTRLLEQVQRVLGGNPRAADAWLPFVREEEHEQLMAELRKRGYGDKGKGDWQEALPKLLEDLTKSRVQDPRRQLDAALRELEQVGTPDQIEPLVEACLDARVAWGQWKFYATIQGILARHEVATLVKAKGMDDPRTLNALAPLLRDLEPAKRGTLASALWERQREDLPLKTQLWLAWSISSVDPEKALAVFKAGLESRDPALRLFAGMAIVRISEGTVPFRLTAPLDETQAARKKWLASLKLHKADDWSLPDPLSLPVIKEQRGGRIDLWWLRSDGSVAREETDVWPTVHAVLPDGTFYSAIMAQGRSAKVLTSPTGESLVFLPDVVSGRDNAAVAAHGGLWGLRLDTREAVEFAPTGEVLWALPVDRSNVSAGFLAPAGPGRALLVRYGKVEILNRRGDVLWSVQEGLDDPRWACMIDADTVLISCKNEVQVHHRTKGLLTKVGNLVSALAVRYHPEKPWMIFDGGTSSVVLYDAKKQTTLTKHIRWTNNDPHLTSKWLKDREP